MSILRTLLALAFWLPLLVVEILWMLFMGIELPDEEDHR